MIRDAFRHALRVWAFTALTIVLAPFVAMGWIGNRVALPIARLREKVRP